jgi:hypothetical protein
METKNGNISINIGPRYATYSETSIVGQGRGGLGIASESELPCTPEVLLSPLATGPHAWEGCMAVSLCPAPALTISIHPHPPSTSKFSIGQLSFQPSISGKCLLRRKSESGSSCVKGPGLGPPGLMLGHLCLLFRLISLVLREAAH